jgi:hypothetical protein
MTWYRKDNLASWSEEYPGHHKILLNFNLEELKQQLGLIDKPVIDKFDKIINDNGL